MTGIMRFEDIEAWQTSREITRLVYGYTDKAPFARDFGLRDQIQRACVSIMSNIAEGFESRTDTQFINYLGHAKGSAGETRSQLYVALDLGYISQEQFDAARQLVEKGSRQISRFIAYLESHPRPSTIRDEAANYTADI
jgi:four helix bundle protein